MMRARLKLLAVTLAAAAVNAALAEEPDWERDLREKLQKKVTFDFADVPLSEAISFLQTLTRINIVVDPHALRERGDAPVTAKVEGATFGPALALVLKVVELDYALLDEVVFISTPERLAEVREREEARRAAEARAREREEPAWKREIREQLARRVTFEFVDTPVDEMTAFLQTLTKMNIILDPEAGRRKRGITLRLTNMSLGVALRWMLRLVELDYALKDGAVFISTPGKIDAESSARIEAATWEDELRRALGRKVSFDFVDTPLTHAISFLQTVSKANMFLDPHALRKGDSAPVTLKVKDMVLDNALKRVLKLGELDYALLDEAVFISTRERLAKTLAREEARRRAEARPREREGPDWERALKMSFDKSVSFEFVETPLSEAVSFFQTFTKVGMILDPGATEGPGEPITLRVQNMSLGSALRWSLRLAGLDYVVTGRCIFVCTPEKAAAERERARAGEASTRGQLLQNIALARKMSFEFVEMTVGEALDFLRREAGVKMVLSPGALEVSKAGSGTISLEIKDMSLRLVLDWILKLANLEYSVGDDAVYIFLPGESPPAKGRAGEAAF